MKIFISQPMRGKTKSEIMEERKQVVDLVKKTENMYGKVEVADSFIEDAPADAKPLWFLAKSLEILSICDVIVAAPGWDSARGCSVEMICAANYGIPVLEVHDGKLFRAKLNVEVREDD